jgi:hypothetical protein
MQAKKKLTSTLPVLIRLVAPILVLVLVNVSILQAQETTLGQLSSSVVYLEGREIKTTMKDDTVYEVWLKHPEKTLLEPQWLEYKGTGFLVLWKDVPYLVTAAHVAKWMGFWAQVAIPQGDSETVTFSLAELCGVSNNIPWIYHIEAAVAVLRLQPSERVQQALENHFLPSQWIMSEEKAPPSDSPLTTIGFSQEKRPGRKQFPVSQTFESSSNLTRYPRFDTMQETTFFFLDKSTFPGFSGAPVFIGLESEVTLVGLVYGTVSDSAGGGFSAAVPSAFIAETLTAASETGSQ